MSKRLATRIGVPTPEERPAGALDAVAFHAPTVGALTRTKGSLFLAAQVTGTSPALARAAREALETIQHDYYYDLSAGVLGALAKAMGNANRRLHHQRKRLGIPRRGGIGVVALVIRGREAHVAKLGPASAVIVRGGRMYELPPPPAVAEEDPRVRERRVAATLGEALQIEPYTWQGDLGGGDRIALLSRNVAQTLGTEELKRSLLGLRPSQAVEHLQQVFGIRGGTGSDALLAIEITEQPITVPTHQLEPVRPAEPLAGLPDQSPVPLADAIGRVLHRASDAAEAGKSALGRGLLMVLSWIVAFVPRRRPGYPRTIPRTAEREAGRRRRLGMAGMAVLAGLAAVGVSVAQLPSATPTEAIQRTASARQAITDAMAALRAVDERLGGADLIDRNPQAARDRLGEAVAALDLAGAAGVSAEQLDDLYARAEHRLDQLYQVSRIARAELVADLRGQLDAFEPREMVAASDGSLWILETGRGRVVRVDSADGSAEVVYRAGQATDRGDAPGSPWLIATAATDVVVVDRERRAWRMDLEERIPRAMLLNGAEELSSSTTLLAALQHRPPLEIFNLYAVDAATGEVRRWSPPAFIPVEYPDPPELYLIEESDLDPRQARDLRVDVNLWLLAAETVTRVDFGVPRGQEEYSLDAPPDSDLRPERDYRHLDGATVGERDYLYVVDAANARLIAFQRADGAFVRQWLAPPDGPNAGLLDDVRGLTVASVADGPPVAFLLVADGVVRVVLE